MQEAAQQIIQDQGGGLSIGCFWLMEKFRTELFFCFNKSKLDSPFLFHWIGKGEKKLNWVESITGYTRMEFKKGGHGYINSALKSALQWTRKWPQAFRPSEHCKIIEKERNYELTCIPIQNNPSRTSAFDWKVSGSELVELNTEFQERVYGK